MALKTIIEAIEARLTALGFTATEEVFDFEAVPDSIANKAYRIESKRAGCEYLMNHLTNPREAIEIYVAYLISAVAGHKPRTAWKTALDDQESIEKDLCTNVTILALASNPLITMDGDASAIKERGDYIVSRMVFNCDYLRDITP